MSATRQRVVRASVGNSEPTFEGATTPTTMVARPMPSAPAATAARTAADHVSNSSSSSYVAVGMRAEMHTTTLPYNVLDIHGVAAAPAYTTHVTRAPPPPSSQPRHALAVEDVSSSSHGTMTDANYSAPDVVLAAAATGSALPRDDEHDELPLVPPQQYGSDKKSSVRAADADQHDDEAPLPRMHAPQMLSPPPAMCVVSTPAHDGHDNNNSSSHHTSSSHHEAQPPAPPAQAKPETTTTTPPSQSLHTTAWQQFVATVRRSLLLQRRHPIAYACELLVAIVFVIGSIALWLIFGTSSEAAMVYYSTTNLQLSSLLYENAMALMCYNATMTGGVPIGNLRECSTMPPPLTPRMNMTLVCSQGPRPQPQSPQGDVDDDDDDGNVRGSGSTSDIPRGFCGTLTTGVLTYAAWRQLAQGNTTVVPALDHVVPMKWMNRLLYSRNSIFQIGGKTAPAAMLSGGTLLFSPDTAATAGLVAYLNATSTYFRYAYGGIMSAAEADERVASHRFGDPPIWAIVDVKQLSVDAFDVTLRPNATAVPSTVLTIARRYIGGLAEAGTELYLFAGMLTLQQAIYRYYLTHILNATLPFDNVALLPAPTAAYDTQKFLSFGGQLAPLILVLGFLYPVSQMTKRIVVEKELRLREAMLIMGVSEVVMYVAWVTIYMVQYAVVSLIMAMMLKLTYVTRSDFGVIFFLLYFFCLSIIALAGLMATLFSKARRAAIVAPLIYFVLSIPLFALENASNTARNGILVLSPSALAVGFDVLFEHELEGGLRGGSLRDFRDSPTMLTVIVVLFCDAVLYTLLMLYLDAVLPKEWGTRRHPLFFVRDPLRRLCGSSAQSRHSAGGGGEDGRYPDGVFEEDEDDDDDTNDDGDDDGRSRRCSVRMVGLRKQYRRNGKPFLAVNNFYWRLREGEIAVLLGHNGAGKTTLMSMLTGMTSPDAGDCFIYGHSVREELSRARQLIGFCPQHNILWPELTCREHLEYYAAIKGLRGSVLQESVQAMLREVDLLDKIDYPSRALSGGQKRKLSIAIAFVGRSPLVFLDEPTAGMDVAARRFTWELLKRMARSHTILLSTHYMDEADLLGDTVAIMNHGRLQCCGTSLFLKARLGLGYVLHLSLAAHASVSDIADLVRGHVAEAESLQTGLTELAFRLPRHRLPAFAALLAAVESRRSELGIAAFSIAATTLEEVFLQLTERAPPPSSLLSTTTRKTMSTKRGGALEGATWTHKAIAVAAGLWLAAARPVAAVCGCHVRRNSDSDNDIDVSGNNNNNNSSSSRSCEATRARADTTATTANATTAVYTTASPHETRLFAQHCHYDDNNNNYHNNSSSSSNVGDADSTVVPVALNAVTTRDGDGAARSLSRLPVSSAASSDSNAGTMMTTTTTTTTTTLAMTPLASAPDSKPVSNVWNVPRLRRRRSVLWSQLKAVLRKRLRNGLRDRRTQFFQVICPVVCVMLAMLLMLIKFFPRQPIALTSDLYGTDVEVDVANCDGVVAPTRPFAARAHTVVVSPEASSASRSDATALSTATLAMSQHMMRTIDTHDLGYERYGGIVCLDPMLVSLAGMLASITYNTTALHESAIAMYNLYDAYYYTELRRRRTGTTTTTTSSAAGDAADNDGDAQRHLHTVIDPMPMTSSERNVNAAIYTMIIGVIIMIPFTFIPSTFVAWIVKERECKARHLQSISGLSYAIYWLSNYVYDVASYIVTMMLVLVVFAIFQRKEYIGADTIGPTIVLLFLYGVSGVSMAYTLSFLFREHSSAQNALLLGNFITGFLLVMCTTMLSLLDNTVKVANVLRWIFRLVPSYCVGEGIINISKNTLTNNGLLRPVSAWSMAVVGWPCAYMAMELPVFLLLTLFIDYPGRRQRAQRLFHDPDAPPEEMVDEDSDVVQEREAVKHAAERAGDHVRVVHLRKKFGNGTVAVRNLTVGVKPGEVFGFLGTNGAGKTTTISILCQEFLPTSGYAYVCGYDIVTHSSEALRCIGYCPQFDATLDLLTVQDHLELYAGIRGIAYSERERVVDGIIQLCELSNYRNVLAHQLSGGNRRKLSVAIALVGGPPVVFLDEPSAGMDPVARRGLWNTIQTVSKDCSIVLTTHHLEEVEVLAHRVAIMVDGTLRCIGDKTHLKHKYGSGFEVSMRLATHAQSFDDVDAFFATRFPGSILRERHAQRVIYELPSDVRLSEVFRQLDAHATALRVADYSISQTSIEQVFLRISEEAERRRCQAEAEAEAEADEDDDGLRRKRRFRIPVH